ncbi:MAG: hypothetical protein N3H31_03710 [Candidatus Nezhaarchaeota archaeon]|nr:hypothetical protein [Candidatus Nezhaarchaeota archaeon]
MPVGEAHQDVDVKAEPSRARRVRIDCGDYEVLIEVRPKAQPSEAPSSLALVLDQTHRGYSPTLERYVPPGVEIHEVGGVGLAEPIKVGARTYRHPAADDYDVLRLLESLSRRFAATVFVTGDKTLSEEATLLKTAKGLNVSVYYMPPSDYPGKESILQAILDRVRESLR